MSGYSPLRRLGLSGVNAISLQRVEIVLAITVDYGKSG